MHGGRRHIHLHRDHDASSRTGTSGTVATVAGAPAKYLVTSSSSTAVEGTAVTISAQLADANNNAISTANQTVTWSSTNGGSFDNATTNTNASGIASVSFTTVAAPGISHVVTATTGAVTGSSAPITTVGSSDAVCRHIVLVEPSRGLHSHDYGPTGGCRRQSGADVRTNRHVEQHERRIVR